MAAICGAGCRLRSSITDPGTLTFRTLTFRTLAQRAISAYLVAMAFISRFNPAPAVADFWNEFRRPQPYRIPILLVSCAVSGSLVYMFTQERVVGPPVKPEVTYITSFAPNRTIEEIRAANAENQARKDEVAALIAQREERKRELYRTLGRASGMDVDEIEAEAEADRAAAEAAEKARIERWMANVADPDDSEAGAEPTAGTQQAE